MLYPTSLVGSYPQPDWLIDRERLAGRFPPRVRASELWRVGPAFLEQAQRDATLLAIRAQEEAGLDIVTDGEIRRESYSNAFATALGGVDTENPGTALDRSGHPNPVPRIIGPIARRHPVKVADVEFLRAHTDRTIKITVPGPFTMAEQAQNDYYPSNEAAAFGYADAVKDEIADLFAAGADIVQLDEPYLQARPEAARQYGVAVLNAALEGITGTTAVHLCFGYAAIIHDRPSGYSFLPELAASTADQISIETAQSGLDCARARRSGRQDDHPRRARPERPDVETRGAGRRPGPTGAAVRARPTARAGARLRDEVPAARRRGRQATAHDTGGAGAARRAMTARARGPAPGCWNGARLVRRRLGHALGPAATRRRGHPRDCSLACETLSRVRPGGEPRPSVWPDAESRSFTWRDLKDSLATRSKTPKESTSRSRLFWAGSRRSAMATTRWPDADADQRCMRSGSPADPGPGWRVGDDAAGPGSRRTTTGASIFGEHPHDVAGDPDVLNLTRPDAGP